MKESSFQAGLVKELKSRYPGCIVTKQDPNYLQGIPDLAVFYNNRYAMLEDKSDPSAKHRPNQDWYVDKVRKMGGFARFVDPENVYDVLEDLDKYFKKGGM